MWIVYDKTGQIERYKIHKLEYNGEFMGKRQITVSIKSPDIVSFAIGDYFNYRGERFTLNSDAATIKKAKPKKVGDSFVYDNIVFNGYSDELTRCEFLDYVLSDNLIHFSSLPAFSFYASSVNDLADRIQANLNRIYTGVNAWSVTVSPEFEGKTGVNVSISNKTFVWGALGLANSLFGANFIIRGRNITIGTAGVAIDNVFEYGKDNGLVKIEKVVQQDQQIITRLRVYGGTRNIPTRYYNKLSNASLENYLPNHMAVQNLMLPSFPYTTLEPYLDSPNIGALGILEGSVFFDGSDESLGEIFPSMEGMTAQQLIDAGVTVNLDSGDNGNLDELASGAVNSDGTAITDSGLFEDGQNIQSFKITLKDVFGNAQNLTDFIVDGATISMKSGMCIGREFEITSCEKVGNKYILTCNRVEDSGIGLYYPYKDYPISSGDKFVLLNIDMPETYIKAASQRLLEAGLNYLSKNDYVRYTYQVNISQVYMARRPELHDSLTEGDLMLFSDTDLNIDGSIVIDKLTIKEGDNIIPSYEITLSDEKQVGSLEKIQNQVDSIVSGKGGGGYNAQQINSLIAAFGGKQFLSKTKPDTAAEIITFLKGLKADGLSEMGTLNIDNLIAKLSATFEKGFTSKENATFEKGLTSKKPALLEEGFQTGNWGLDKDGNLGAKKTTSSDGVFGNVTIQSGLQSPVFTDGFLGEGFKVWIENGKANAVLDNLTIRNNMNVFQLVIQKIQHVGGAFMFSAASGEIERIVELPSGWQCYLKDPANNDFQNFDQVICQTFTKNKTKRYFRAITQVGTDYVQIVKNDAEAGSAIPEVGDTIVQLGNRSNAARRNAIYISSYGTSGPYMQFLSGIDSFDLTGKVDSQIGKETFFTVDKLEIRSADGKKERVARDRGEWVQGTTYYYYDRVTYSGSLWLCMINNTTDKPSSTSGGWEKQTNVQVGGKNLLREYDLRFGGKYWGITELVENQNFVKVDLDAVMANLKYLNVSPSQITWVYPEFEANIAVKSNTDWANF